MRRYVLTTIAVAMAVPFGMVGVADARRPATASEKRAIVGANSRCYKVYVSSIDGRYASAEYDARTYKIPQCAKSASNGIDIERRRNGRWTALGGMSDCPRSIPHVPRAIYRELTRVFCGGRWRG
jgi:hypothetical protein